jgi:hypothetical protein
VESRPMPVGHPAEAVGFSDVFRKKKMKPKIILLPDISLHKF